MAAKLTNRKRYKKRPGLTEAAKELGCTYSHLRRVSDGERRSPALLNRYQSIQSASATANGGQS